MKAKKDYKSEVLEIIETKDWVRARRFNDINLYGYIKYHKDTDENCKTIWERISQQSRDYKSEISEIIETKDWVRARRFNDINLYSYIYCHKGEDENCKTIWEHIKTKTRDLKSEILKIIETKDWDRAKKSNDESLYQFVFVHKDEDENCKTIWEHIRLRDYKSEISEIIETKDWDKAKKSNDINLYNYIKYHKYTDKNCKIIWDHIKTHHTIKDYLQYYFEHGKPKSRNTLYQWFTKEINKGNQCCIDIKNLIIAVDIYQDPVAIETLSLIKNHLENKEGD